MTAAQPSLFDDDPPPAKARDGRYLPDWWTAHTGLTVQHRQDRLGEYLNPEPKK